MDECVKKMLELDWADATITDISYVDNDILSLKIKNYQGIISEYKISGIYKLFFEDYLNDDISHLDSKQYSDTCTIMFFSSSTDKVILEFSYFI